MQWEFSRSFNQCWKLWRQHWASSYIALSRMTLKYWGKNPIYTKLKDKVPLELIQHKYRSIQQKIISYVDIVGVTTKVELRASKSDERVWSVNLDRTLTFSSWWSFLPGFYTLNPLGFVNSFNRELSLGGRKKTFSGESLWKYVMCFTCFFMCL